VATDSERDALSLNLLGSFQLVIQGKPAPPLRSRQAQALFAWLVLSEGRDRDRAVCADQLWPESRPEQALANLRQNLASIRAALGPEAWRLVTVDRRTIRFDGTGAVIDVLEFDRLAGSNDPALWRQAVQLYRGALLPGVSGEAIGGERNHRQRKVESLLERLIQSVEVLEAERYALELLRQDSTNEIAIRKLLEAKSRRRDIAGAIRLFEDFRRTLHRLYGTDPSPESIAAYEAALARCKEVPEPEKAAWTPGFLRPMVGRQKEGAALLALVHENRCVTLVGTGGVGKTRLLAATLEGMGNGVWIDCSNLLHPSLAGLEEAIRSQIGVARGQVSLEEALQPRIEAGPFFLVFDAIECARAEVFACIERLRRLVGVAFVCAGREPLEIGGECVMRLTGLSEADGLEMFRQLSGTTDDLDRDLVRQLDGFPLAIEVVAPLSQTMSIGQLLEEVRKRGVLGLNRAGGAKLLDALEVSWTRLDSAEQKLLGTAAIMPGPFSTRILMQAAGVEDGELVLGGLVAKSWVIHSPHIPSAPYSLPNIAREYVLERTSADAHAMVEAYAEFADDCRQHFQEASGSERLVDLSAHSQNIERAIDLAFQEEWGDLAYGLVGACWGCFLYAGRFAEARRITLQCLSRTYTDPTTRIRVLNAAGFILRGDGDFQESIDLHRRAIDEANECGDELSIAESHARLGLSLSDSGSYGPAIRSYKVALGLFRVIGNRWWETAITHEMATTYHFMGDHAASERHLARAIVLAREIGDPLRWAGLLESRARILMGRGQFDEARGMLNQAIETYQGLSAKRSEMNSNLITAHLSRAEGKWVEAIALYKETIRVAAQTGYLQTAHDARFGMGWAYLDQGDTVAAEVCFDRVYADAFRRGQTGRAIGAKEALGACFLMSGQRADALQSFRESLKLAELDEVPDSTMTLLRRYGADDEFLVELLSSLT